ncbi:glutamine amidotransferase [Gymnopilus junonius]|uniref:Multifunctional tryptophan biosynthesis protein n=1 Tax=Gymnopilus junonius TaxID=109634 RepID=A0A9P5NIH3_GYMJU|nr:glutamine amidotransferase [Gymnopilus junonius]
MSSESLSKQLTGQLDVLMIDNFDSFTWNLYQQLCLHGADVTVIRNDAISPSLFPQLHIKFLVISPGPGHPQTDSGISKAAIEYFQGKVPVLGVCMGLECLVDLYGGKIGYAGEIMHGKVSCIRHDNRGCFRGIPQGIKSIRYHSLSAALTTLPPELAITSATEESGVIMGVRHRKYTVEAVQYHPESILSEGGNDLIRNFLSLRGGLWEENPEARVFDKTLPPFPFEALPNEITSKPGATTKVPSILEKIYAQRLADVALAQATPGTTLADLKTLLSLNVTPPLIPFVSRIKETTPGQPALFAEIKRASPSKGHISISTSPAKQALTYALSGAHVISVLTEPKWFLGSLQDMLHARLSVAHLRNRPAILRKDFILSRYQVLEARLWGADTILLIVSMLPEALLKDLYAFSLELGMEPLVEVNNAKEMEIALSLPAKVVGVNNRNLHDFNVDMGTTSRLRDMVTNKDVILCALSGISSAEDVKRYASEGIRAVLIGESLMRAKDTAAFICGIRSKDEALAVAAAGADFLGLMFVPKSKRAIGVQTGKEISQAIRNLRYDSSIHEEASISEGSENAPWFTKHAVRLSLSRSRPLLVGVFQDAPLGEILQIVSEVQLDIVQLHGSEPTERALHIPVPVIRVFHVGKSGKGVENITRGGYHQFVLLDSLRDDDSGVSGGSGKVVDWELAKRVVEGGEIITNTVSAKTGARLPDGDVSEAQKPNTSEPADNSSQDGPPDQNGAAAPAQPSAFPLPIILAGGLTSNNVAAAIAQVQPWAVDVSGGVENEDGSGKDLEKVKAFIANAKGFASVESGLLEEGQSEEGSESVEA